jgi:hypothetical protein
MTVLQTESQHIVLSAVINPIGNQQKNMRRKVDLLQPLRQWIDALEIQNRKVARFIAKLIPAQCPFERDIVLFGRRIAHIPPMCKLNPLYDQFIGLRFRALCYLVDQCGEDIQSYC